MKEEQQNPWRILSRLNKEIKRARDDIHEQFDLEGGRRRPVVDALDALQKAAQNVESVLNHVPARRPTAVRKPRAAKFAR